MQYPLQEKIGNPDLLVGREKEFRNFGKWIANIPKKLSKSRVILARRKGMWKRVRTVLKLEGGSLCLDRRN